MLNNNEEKDSKFVIYAKAILRGLILSIILIFIVALIFYFANVKDSYIDTAGWIISILGISYSSIYCANKIGQKGFLHGAFIGIIYIIIIFIVDIITQKSSFSGMTAIIKLSMSIVVGALSGMIGIVIGNN